MPTACKRIILQEHTPKEGKEIMDMTIHTRHFDRDKALEVILYIAAKLEAPTLHSISKILYLADKQHLQDFGRLICGDQYIAMEYGPVPSTIYNMMKVADDRGRIDVDMDEQIKESFTVVRGREVRALRPANTDLLAESEIASIARTLEKYGRKSFGQLTDITHDDAWNDAGLNQAIPIEAIARTLPDAEALIAYLRAD